MLCLFIGFTLSCSKQGPTKTASTNSSYDLQLSMRPGDAPWVPREIPHQQRNQNSPESVLLELENFLFSLEHVVEKSSGSSFPSALGAFIKSGVKINNAINREFTHIHMEPGPGSQHLTLREKDFQLVFRKGWGIRHPWSNRLSEKGYVLMMIYAPRNKTDLQEIKKINLAAYHLVLSTP